MGVRPQSAKGKDRRKPRAARMPEVEKQSAVASEGSGESLEKPGGLSFEVVLEEAKIKEPPKLECPPTPTPSVEDIEKRLKVITPLLFIIIVTLFFFIIATLFFFIIVTIPIIRRQRIAESRWKLQLWRSSLRR